MERMYRDCSTTIKSFDFYLVSQKGLCGQNFEIEDGD